MSNISKITVGETTYDIKDLNAMTYADNGVLGAKNLLKNDATSQTVSGITFTVNSDGSVTVNGTASANVSYRIKTQVPLIEGKTYICSRGEAGDNDFQMVVTAWNSGTYVKNIIEIGAGDYTEKSFAVDYDGYNDVQISIFVRSGKSISNAVVYPMIRLASDPDDTYVPYAMTNRELTEELTIQESAVTDIIEGATVGDTGNYLYKQGKIVWLTLRLNGVTTTAWADNTPIGMIPEGFRPRKNLRILNSGNANALQPIQINASGSILCAVNLSNQTVILTATWITN